VCLFSNAKFKTIRSLSEEWEIEKGHEVSIMDYRIVAVYIKDWFRESRLWRALHNE